MYFCLLGVYVTRDMVKATDLTPNVNTAYVFVLFMDSSLFTKTWYFHPVRPIPFDWSGLHQSAFPPQEHINNPLYVEEVQVVDKPAQSAHKPDHTNKVRFTFTDHQSPADTYQCGYTKLFSSSRWSRCFCFVATLGGFWEPSIWLRYTKHRLCSASCCEPTGMEAHHRMFENIKHSVVRVGLKADKG